MTRKDSLVRLKQYGVVTIPAGWIQSRVKYLGTYMNGYPFKPSDWGTEGRPILRIQDLSGSNSEPNRFDGEIDPRYMIRRGVILISWSASLGVYRWIGEDAWLNQHIFKVEVDRKRLREDFFVWLAEWFIAEMDREAHGSTMQHLTADAFGGFPVLLPPDPQQRTIADYLDRETARIDALITTKERLLELLAEKRRALITRAATRGLDPDVPLRDSGIPWLGEIPAHWNLNRAKYLFKQSSLPVRDTDEIVTCFRDGQVTLRSNRRQEGFTKADLEAGYQGIRTGQLVLHSMDAFAGAIGVSDSDGKCSPEYIICDPVFSRTNNFYYAGLLRTMALAGFIQASCPAVRERAPRIRFPSFSEMYLPLPPTNEQNEIADHIATETFKLDELSIATEKTITLLKERRAALIAAAVTGQIDVGGDP